MGVPPLPPEPEEEFVIVLGSKLPQPVSSPFIEPAPLGSVQLDFVITLKKSPFKPLLQPNLNVFIGFPM